MSCGGAGTGGAAGGGVARPSFTCDGQEALRWFGGALQLPNEGGDGDFGVWSGRGGQLALRWLGGALQFPTGGGGGLPPSIGCFMWPVGSVPVRGLSVA